MRNYSFRKKAFAGEDNKNLSGNLHLLQESMNRECENFSDNTKSAENYSFTSPITGSENPKAYTFSTGKKNKLMNLSTGFFMFALIGFLLFGITGCSSKTEETNGENSAAKVSAISYLIQNPINVETMEINNYASNAPDTSLYTKLVVSGLSDSTVQEKINQTITDQYEQMTNNAIPAYRGITYHMDSAQSIQSEALSMNVMGNFNNILSILITRTASQGGLYFTDCQTLNFNLNTGELITLADLFENEEGVESLNSLIGAKLSPYDKTYTGGTYYDTSRDYFMLSVFKGINDEQKFYLMDGRIYIIFDYENEEFYQPHCTPYDVDVAFDELDESFDIFKFVDSETDIYSSDEPEKCLLVYGSEKLVEEYVPSPNDTGRVNYSLEISYPEGIPDTTKAQVQEWSTVDTEFLNQLEAESAANTTFEYGLHTTVNSSRIGNYYNVVRDVSYYKANYWGQSIVSKVYDLKGNELKIEDLFNEGTDYESVIKSGIVEQLSYDFPDGNYGGYTLDDIYSNITFSLDSYGLQIKTQPIAFTMGVGETDYQSSISVFIPYEEFGCLNMVVFN